MDEQADAGVTVLAGGVDLLQRELVVIRRRLP
jgi:hypothetical protein